MMKKISKKKQAMLCLPISMQDSSSIRYLNIYRNNLKMAEQTSIFTHVIILKYKVM